jgi:flavin prenyltransferase
VIFSPAIAYYAWPTSVDEVTNHVVGRVIGQLGIEHFLINRWKDDQRPVPVSGNRQLVEADDQPTRLDDKPCRPHGR